MRILTVIQRLKDQCALLDNRAEPAKSLIGLSDSEIQYELPTAFVLPLKEQSGPSQVISGTSQMKMKRFAVIVAAKTSSDTQEYLEDIREQIAAALEGWQPDAEHDYINHVEGEIIDMNSRVTYWRDTFETWTLS